MAWASFKFIRVSYTQEFLLRLLHSNRIAFATWAIDAFSWSVSSYIRHNALHALQSKTSKLDTPLWIEPRGLFQNDQKCSIPMRDGHVLHLDRIGTEYDFFMASPGACWVRDFGEVLLQNVAWAMSLFPSSITTSHAMAISSVAISTNDAYNPDAGVGMVFSDKLRTIRRMAVGGMTSSASQTSCEGVVMALNFLGMWTSFADEIRWAYPFLVVWTLTIHLDGLPVSPDCVHFSGYSNVEKDRNWHPTYMIISQNCRTC